MDVSLGSRTPETLAGPQEPTSAPASSAGAGRPADTLPDLGPRFERIRLLGRGAMGAVYLARDRQLRRHVAVKCITSPAHAAGTQRGREAWLTARIDHPNVVTVHDVHGVDGAVYIISEYIEGKSLDRIQMPVEWTRALAWGLDLARGLAAAHERGVLHRDIKPANAILDERSQQAKLIDFGVAKLVEDRGDPGDMGSAGTPPGARPGTPCYQAPEIWDGEPASTRTDVYALGVLLYELCTGQRPPVVADPATRRAIRIQRDDVDVRFAHVVNRCLDLDPARRYASGTDLAEALARLHAAPIEPKNPYRGLLCFQERHGSLFFGREMDTARIIERVRAAPFLLLVGESGVGKSSLVHAGVLPRLRRGELDPERAWTIVTMVPGRRPLAALARALSHGSSLHLAIEIDDEIDERSAGVAEDDFARAAGVQAENLLAQVRHGSLPAVVRDLHARHQRGSTGLVLFVDQLEELLTVSEPEEAQRAQALLAHLIEQRLESVRILAAVRGDYLTQIAELPELGRLLQEHIYLVRTLVPAGIRAAIVQPAQMTGVKFESDELVDSLLQATLRARGGLPLLQFALAELWTARDAAQGVITRRSLEEIGGVEGALARYADDVLAELPRREQHDTARRLLLKLVALHHRARMRCTKHDLVGVDGVGNEVLEHLVDKRLLVCHLAEGEWVYSIAHEALLTAWPTLRAWLDRERELVTLKGQLADAAQQWESLGRSGDALWGRRLLREAERIDMSELSSTEAAFLAASRRALFRSIWLLRGIILAVLVLVVGIYAVSRHQARRALARKVDGHLAEASQSLARASVLHGEYLDMHAQVQRRLGAGEDGWEEPWHALLALDPRLGEAYRKADQAASAAYALDPIRDDVSALLARGLEERARFAEATGRHEDREELVERLAMIAPDRAAYWHAPVSVTIETVPGEATVEIQKYVWQRHAPFNAQEIKQSDRTPLEANLTPGSYLVVVHATPGRAEVRYPLLVARTQKDGDDRAEVSIYRPRASDVPQGFVYISEGWSWHGYGQTPEQEPYRVWHESPPLHQRHTDAYLIRKYETTYREWLEYVDECTRTVCPGGAHPPSHIKADDGVLWLEVERVPGRGWQIYWKPDPEHEGYRAMAGKPLVYDLRTARRSQDWLDFPVSGVSWPDVQGYLAWLREIKGIRGADLCTDAQWERAARGADARLYPHGNGMGDGDANIDKSYGQVQGAFGPDTVGLHRQSMSPFGVHDMAGNVAEMIAQRNATGRTKTDSARDEKDLRVARGGAFFYSAVDSRVFGRWDIMVNQPLPQVGFRVCAAAPTE